MNEPYEQVVELIEEAIREHRDGADVWMTSRIAAEKIVALLRAPKDGVKVGTIGHVAPPGFGPATDACGVPERKRPATGASPPLPPAGPTGSGGWCEMCGVTHEGPHPAAGVTPSHGGEQ